ncbi:MAG TPA: helix-turn-helix domain-containing GNAT family N-acetyltransferase [Thermomicrobiales bacterium]|nr:helix-turn-helix domain-containing GNAT family N-acetyltransferase [Thermomicrobiales bacterium]
MSNVQRSDLAANELDDRVAAIRRFNRFITRRIGALQEGLLHSPFSLTEARVLFELGQGAGITASGLAAELGLDPGYLSRILASLKERGFLEKERSETDGRRLLLSLTPEGREAYKLLDGRAREEVAELLAELKPGDQERLLDAMTTIESILTGSFKYAEPFVLREPEPGDMGWIVHRHGALYASEYGWNAEFEALVARIVADYVSNHDPECERCWIAEMGGEVVGSVFVVRQSDDVAKLRLLLVEPKARGLGLGSRLVDECIRFARRKGYRKVTLWTNDVLHAARHIYQSKGFVLVDEGEHQSFGKDLVEQTWELAL